MNPENTKGQEEYINYTKRIYNKVLAKVLALEDHQKMLLTIAVMGSYGAPNLFLVDMSSNTAFCGFIQKKYGYVAGHLLWEIARRCAETNESASNCNIGIAAFLKLGVYKTFDPLTLRVELADEYLPTESELAAFEATEQGANALDFDAPGKWMTRVEDCNPKIRELMNRTAEVMNPLTN